MKKRFSIIFILLIILTFFPRESYAITDSKCDAAFNTIKNYQNKTEFEELDYYKVYVPSIKFRQIWDYEKKDFVWFRDKNKNLEIARINSYSILGELRIKIGDKLVRVDGKEVSPTRFWVDDEEVGPITFGGHTPVKSPVEFIGWDFMGKMDEVRMWNVARTQSEIQSTMNRKLTGK